MERFIDGPTLKQVLRRREGKPLPVDEALVYLKALSSALGYAHNHGVVHCDVKPGNVMIDQGGSIYLTDFGVARHAESTTTTLGFAGTAAYMAPEQIRGEAVTAQTDVYALGVMLYEMLTGRRPFRGDEWETEGQGSTIAERVRYAHVHLEPPNPQGLNTKLQDKLAAVILKALAKDPRDRFLSMRELYEGACEAVGVTPEKTPDRLVGVEGLVFASTSQARAEVLDSVQHAQTTIEGSRRILPWPLGNKVAILTGGVGLGAFAIALILSIISSARITRTSARQEGIVPESVKKSPVSSPTVLPMTMLTQSSTRTPTLIVGTNRISATDDMVMVFVPEGEFLFGSTSDDLARMILLCPDCDPESIMDQSPQRRIYLDGYWIDQTEVTNVQFAKFVSETGYLTTAEQQGNSSVLNPSTGRYSSVKGANWRHPRGGSSSIVGRENYPVTQMSWYDAVAYCSWADRRLPTEAEWEKAARGADGRLYPWGNEPPQQQQLNYNVSQRGPVLVGSYPDGMSPYGVMDMAGNLWEWVSDFYNVSYYRDAPERNPTGPLTGEGHTFRGGSWASEHRTEMVYVTTTYRLWNRPHIRSDVLGFRCAADASP